MKQAAMKAVFAQLLLMSMAGLLWAQSGSTPMQEQPADNTKVNERDRSKAEPTADQQKENSSDRELARQIRRSLVKDKSLSTYAHNVKVIVQNGTVTLKGPVRSDEEKRTVEAKAAEVAGGSDKITSELQIAMKNADKPSAGQEKTNY
jgi:hyperosmotically inducible periplasmic protein